jgi:hypothetical protein
MLSMRRGTLALTLFLILTLMGCSGQPERPSPSEILGPYTATGTVVATGGSLFRRGTHVLQVNGKTRFYLESKVVDLGGFEETLVVIRGELSPNTHPSFLPVLEVASVEAIELLSPPALQRYEVPMLGISIKAPVSLQGSVVGERLTFLAGGEAEPAIVIQSMPKEPLPEGLAIRLGERIGVRIVDETTGQHRVYVEGEEKMLLFTFTPQGEVSQGMRDTFYTMLRSVEFSESAEEEAPPLPEEGGGESAFPCGGPAAVLCPEGMFCEVTDLGTGIGVCRKLPE